MGITIKSKLHNIDMGCSHFYHLRKNIAYAISDDVGKAYEELFWHYMDVNPSPEKEKQLAKTYQTAMYATERDYHLVHGFLWASDCGGRRSAKTCAQILELIQRLDDDIKIGYPGWGEHCAKMSDFKQILKDCIENNTMMKWY